MRGYNLAGCLLLVLLQQAMADDENLDIDFKFHSVEKILIKKLLEDYEKIGKIGRPVRNTSDILKVEFGLSIFQLMDLDETNQLLTVNVWNKFTWRDELLTWEPEKYNGLTNIRIPVRHIWSPDIVLYNYADERMVELREVLLTVDYTGQIFWSPPSIYKSVCRIQIERFPFDHQTCYLRFASWTLDGRRMNLTFLGGQNSASLDDYQESNEWHVVAKPAIRRYFTQTCCLAPFPNLIFFFVLKRNPDFYAYLLVLPCILLAVLNLVTFWLPPQNPARMMLGMNIFVGFCIQMKFLTASTPSASNTIPYLGYYYCLNMVLIAVSTFLSLIAVNIHFKRNKKEPIPVWLAKAVSKLSKMLHLQPLHPPSDVQEPYINKLDVHLVKDRRRCRSDRNPGENHFFARSEGLCFWQPTDARQRHESLGLQSLTATTSTGQQLEARLRAIKRALRSLLHKVNEKDNAARLANEWAAVGLAIDRFCFWVYLILIVATGMGTLIPPIPTDYASSINEEVLIRQFKELSNHAPSID